MSKQKRAIRHEEPEVSINNAPSKISLIIGEVQGEVDFLSLKGIEWNIKPQGDYDLRYVHESIYETAYSKANMYKNAYTSSREALRDHKKLNSILIKYLSRLVKLANLQELMSDDVKYLDAMQDDLNEVLSQIKDFE